MFKVNIKTPEGHHRDIKLLRSHFKGKGVY